MYLNKKRVQRRFHWVLRLTIPLLIVGALNARVAAAATLATPSHSTTIALTSDDRRVVAVNREANSVSILRVRNAQGRDVHVKLAEISVGLEPRCVAISPDDRQAFVTNGISGTVSVVNLQRFRVVATIRVGAEPRGCALTPNGALLYVANHTEGTVSIINTSSRSVVGTVFVGRNPTAIAVTNNGDDNDLDERVFVTQIFAEIIANGPGEGRNLGKEGVVQTFPVAHPNQISKITLAPLADTGFTSNRTNFCPNLNPNIHPPHKLDPIFCPDPNVMMANTAITNNPQGAFPNQLSRRSFAVIACGCPILLLRPNRWKHST